MLALQRQHIYIERDDVANDEHDAGETERQEEKKKWKFNLRQVGSRKLNPGRFRALACVTFILVFSDSARVFLVSVWVVLR